MDYQKRKAENQALNLMDIQECRTRMRALPLVFWLDITGVCNLKCSHCEFQIHGRTSLQEIPDDIYNTTVKKLLETAYVLNLGGTNLGEMTVAKKFPQVVKDCLDRECRINLTTNGTVVGKNWLDDLTDAAEVIGFSMEGMEGQYEAIRGHRWTRFLGNVEKFIEARARRGAKYRAEWRYCTHADNIHQLPDMIRLAHQMGVDRIQVMNLVPYVPEQKYKNLFYHRSMANRYFQEARAVAQELSFDVDIPDDFDLGTFHIKNELSVKHVGPPPASNEAPRKIQMEQCFQPHQRCSINELGIVKACCIHWRPKGDLHRADFDAIWNGWRYRRMRASVNTNPDEICYRCRLSRYDAEENTNAALKPSMAEIVRGLLKPSKKPEVAFTQGPMDSDKDRA